MRRLASMDMKVVHTRNKYAYENSEYLYPVVQGAYVNTTVDSILYCNLYDTPVEKTGCYWRTYGSCYSCDRCDTNTTLSTIPPQQRRYARSQTRDFLVNWTVCKLYMLYIIYLYLRVLHHKTWEQNSARSTSWYCSTVQMYLHFLLALVYSSTKYLLVTPTQY